MNTASEISTFDPANTASKRRRIRWRIPLVILALAAANLVRLRSASDLEGNFKNMQTFMTIGAGILLLIVWLVFLSGLRWRTCFATLGVIILFVAGLRQLVRFDGTADGTGIPRIVWKWTPKNSGDV